jgi:hypothetical protein
MNIRNATLTIRHRKNELFEQERVTSLDYDKQRSGGTPSKQGKSDSSASKRKNKRRNQASH